MNKHHQEILILIKENANTPTQHTFLEGYLGNAHPKYAIDSPTLRLIAKEWMRDHKTMKADGFQKLITSLVKGKSATEKMIAGMLLDLSTKEQRSFDPTYFDEWLNHVEGWAEIDTLCTGVYSTFEILNQWPKWKKQLIKFSKSKNINKRRASLVFLCSAVSKHNDLRLAQLAIANIEQLKHEKEILITKAISWLLRSMVRYHKSMVSDYVKVTRETLPAIAVRETMVKIETGRKNPKF
ncbi:MAG: DNA alkylation repair protein [Flammeovirgaceae bacterium]